MMPGKLRRGAVDLGSLGFGGFRVCGGREFRVYLLGSLGFGGAGFKV